MEALIMIAAGWFVVSIVTGLITGMILQRINKRYPRPPHHTWTDEERNFR
jgi:ABC-type Co2+ transport system permease subunit